ncbi:MAG: DUF3833 domain-containing protein [Azospirillaceae bacterium]
MRRRTAALLGLLVVTLLSVTGCSMMKPEDFEGREPRFVLEEYFAGKTKAWGIFQDRFGTLRRQFTVDITGDWDGRTLTLVEDFVYEDGETERRTWVIEKIDEHTYEGRSEDGVIGTALMKAYGNAVNFAYDFDLKMQERTLRVRFEDWMFLQDDEVMINRATVSKFGIRLGSATIVFRRQPSEAERAQSGEEDDSVLAAQ